MKRHLVLAMMVAFVVAIMGVRPINAQDFGFSARNRTVSGVSNKGVTGAGLTLIPGIGGVPGYLNINTNGTQFTVSGAPTFDAVDVATGDFNGDGRLDIIAVDNDNAALVLLTGQGDGTFGFPIAFGFAAPGFFPVSVSAADIDLDGLTDVAVALNDGATGSGDAGFVEVFSGFFLQSLGFGITGFDGLFPTSFEPVSVTFGRLNDDALQDFAVLESSGPGGVGQIEVYFSDQATFSYDLGVSGPFATLGTVAQDTVGPIPSPRSIFIQQNNLVATEFGDTTVDSTLDIFAATSFGVEFFDNAGVGQIPTILQNGTIPNLFAGSNPDGVVVADLNKDNTLDVLVLNHGSGTVSTFLAIVATGGGYTAPLQSLAGANPISLTPMNFNGDANLDLAVVNNGFSGGAFGTGNLQILLGTGTGAFTQGTVFSINNNLLPIFDPQSVAVGHFDTASTTDDIVLADGASVFGNTGGLLFLDASQSYGPVQLKIFSAVSLAADFDGTGGLNDVALMEQNFGQVFILLNISSLTAPTVGQINILDLFTLANIVPTSATAFKSAVTGLNDIAITDIGTPTLNTGSGQIIIGQNDGTGTFSDVLQFRQFVATPGATNILNGDFNNDGFDDLAYVDFVSNFAAVVLNDSTDFFLTPHFRETGGFVPVSAAIADVNDDDNLDLVVVNTGASPNTSNQSIVSVLDGDGEGNLVPTGALLQVPNFGISIVGGLQDIEDNGDGTGVTRRVVDFNNDGYPDFAVASTRGANNPNGFLGNQPAATVSLIINRADSPGNFVVQPPIGLIDDTNGAQQFGSLSLESSFGGPGLVTGRGGENPPFGLTGIGFGGANYVMAVGDFNADGSPDLVVTGAENDLATGLLTGVLAFVPYRSSIFLIGNETNGTVRVSRPQRTGSYASNSAVGLNFLNDAGDTFVACAVGNFLPAPNNVPDVFHLSLNGNIFVDQNISSILNHAPILTIERDVAVKNENLNAPFPGGGRKEIITAGEAATVPITGFDADGDDLAFSLVSPPNGQPAPSFVTVMKTGRQSAEVMIEQGAATNPGPGPAVFRIAVEASDKANVGGSGNRLPLTGRTYFTLVVEPATPPEIGAIAPITVEAGKSETVNLSITQAQGFAVETSVSCDKGNFVSINGTTLTVSPALSDVGTATCTLKATNMMKNVNGEIVGGLSSTASFTVTVTAPNLPPTISPITNQTVSQGQTASVAVSASDPNGNTGLKLSLTQAPAFVSLSDNGNGTGTIRIAPTLADTTGGMVTVQVTDPGGLSAQTSFQVAVQKVVIITAASFDTAGKQLFISGSGFGSSGASVSVNGKDVTSRIIGQSDQSITVKGGRKKLNLKSGPNVLTVTSGGVTSSPFTLNLLSSEDDE